MVPAVAGLFGGLHIDQAANGLVCPDGRHQLLVVERLAVALFGEQHHDRHGPAGDALEDEGQQEEGPADLGGLHQVDFLHVRVIERRGNAKEVRGVVELVEAVEHARFGGQVELVLDVLSCRLVLRRVELQGRVQQYDGQVYPHSLQFG